ncbi:MAG: hypothetical protein CM1200mP2_45320 [Planctomycetaceae bacterium]|nr:MAG: hypothetical protein CM1200mP2_45320 [Planctomycetaceae bacterium]
MRTGIHGYIDPHDRRNLDQPLLVAWSADDGVNGVNRNGFMWASKSFRAFILEPC